MAKRGKDLSNRFWIIVVAICSILLVIVTISLIAFNNRKPEIVEKEEEGGFVTLNYTSEVNALTILHAKPMTDEVGMKNMTEGQYFDFSVDVNVDEAPKVEYEISVIKDKNSSTIDDDDIRIYLEKEDSGTYTKVFGPSKYVASKNYSTVGSELGSMILVNSHTIKTITENYRLRLWLSNEATIPEGSFSVEVDIHAIAK